MSGAYAEVIGDPIRQSKSPAIHGYWLDQLGLAGSYRATHVLAEGLDAFLAARRVDRDWRGCNVTMPHKQAVIAGLDRLDPLAAQVGAVNTIVPEWDGLVGYNTDVPGFLEPLLPWLEPVRRLDHALVIGSGGAARAIILALASAGLPLTIAARDLAKARILIESLAPGRAHGVIDIARIDPAGFGAATLVVNASALGMAGQPALPIDPRAAPAGTVFYDIVTSPVETALIAGARAAGHPVIDGLAMLIGQADHAFRRFFGAIPPRGAANLRLRALLTGAPA